MICRNTAALRQHEASEDAADQAEAIYGDEAMERAREWVEANEREELIEDLTDAIYEEMLDPDSVIAQAIIDDTAEAGRWLAEQWQQSIDARAEDRKPVELARLMEE